MNDKMPRHAGMSELELYEWLSQRVRYEDGNLMWVQVSKNSLRGKPAGALDALGYRRINIDNKMIPVHRLIFFMHHEYLPPVVDHIDGNNQNNRVENLRAATISQNNFNARKSAANTSGRKGVYWSKSTQKWQASIRSENVGYYLGVFETFEEAVAAREEAERVFHGEFKRSA